MSELCLVWCECMVLLGVNICNRVRETFVIIHKSAYLCVAYVT